MARRKQTVTQRSFVLGQTREEFLEGDDLEIRQASLRCARNMRVTAPRTIKSRPGSWMRRNEATAYDIVEIRPSTDAVFALVITATHLRIINSSGEVVQAYTAPWTNPADVYVVPFREDTVIGGSWGIRVLRYTSGTWSLGTFTPESDIGGEPAQAYWVFNRTAKLKPSATTGNITVTASSALFSSQWVGLTIRYGRKPILITSYVSPTVVNGTVLGNLPPSYGISLDSVRNFTIGEVVVGEDTNFSGYIVDINYDSTALYVVTDKFYEGPDVGEKIVGPHGASKCTHKIEFAPLFSPIWDEPLISLVRGYPRSASSVAGRLVFIDFPLVPSLVAASSAGNIYNWKVTASDDGAITREVGDNSPRFLHAINAGDLLLLSDRGCYYIPVRDNNGVLSPSTFNAIFFDERASSTIRPVRVESGVVFVEASRNTISAALLDGNIYLKWSVKPISNFHSDLIRSPTRLCGPSLNSDVPEKYLFIVNEDGTMASVSWSTEFGGDATGFIEWDTEGHFVSVAPAFGSYWPIVDRAVNGSPVRFIEEFSEETLLDCTIEYSEEFGLNVGGSDVLIHDGGDSILVLTPSAAELAGTEVHFWADGYYCGTQILDANGAAPDPDAVLEDAICGFNFIGEVGPWPVEVVESPRGGMLQARTIRTGVSVLETGTFQCIANNTTRTIEAYRAGDDLSEPPPNRTAVYRFSVFGTRLHPEITYRKHQPGNFHIMAITTEVQY